MENPDMVGEQESSQCNTDDDQELELEDEVGREM